MNVTGIKNVSMEFLSDMVAAGASDLILKWYFQGKESEGKTFVESLKAKDIAKAQSLFDAKSTLGKDDEEVLIGDALLFGNPAIQQFFGLTAAQVQDGWAWLAGQPKHVRKGFRHANWQRQDDKSRHSKFAEFFRATNDQRLNVLTLAGIFDPTLLDRIAMWATEQDPSLDARITELKRLTSTPLTIAEAFYIRRRTAATTPVVTGGPGTTPPADSRPRGIKLLETYRLAALNQAQMWGKRLTVLAVLFAALVICASAFAGFIGPLISYEVLEGGMGFLVVFAVLIGCVIYVHAAVLSGAVQITSDMVSGGLADFLGPILPGAQRFSVGWSENTGARFKAGMLNAMVCALTPLNLIILFHVYGTGVAGLVTAGLLIAMMLGAWPSEQKWKRTVQMSVMVINAISVILILISYSLTWAGVNGKNAASAWSNVASYLTSFGPVDPWYTIPTILFVIWIIYMIVNIKTIDFWKQVRGMLGALALFAVLWFSYRIATGIGNFFSELKTNRTTQRQTASPGATAQVSDSPSAIVKISDTKYRVTISAKTELFDTGLDVTNKKIRITYIGGQWTNGGTNPVFSDAGGSGNWSTTVMPTAPFRALVGKTSQGFFLVGNHYEGKPGSGKLYLTQNDTKEGGGYSDNQGSLVVEIEIL